MSTAHFVHGFNVSDGGRNTTDKLIPYFADAGFRIHDQDYGWIGLVGVRLFNGLIAGRLTDAVKAGDVGVGHSNGCAILARAARTAPFDGLVFINPALNADCVVAPHVRWVHVYHTKHDRPVKLSKWLPFHQWGDMGARGFTGNDMRYTNVNLSDEIRGHSEVFQRVEKWGPVIVGNVLAAR